MFPAAAARLFWANSDKGLSGQDRHTETHTHTLVEKESSDVEPSVLVKVQDACCLEGLMSASSSRVNRVRTRVRVADSLVPNKNRFSNL